MTRYTIHLPLPPRELQPNARCHWRIKAEHVHCARSEAMYAVFAQYGPSGTLPHLSRALVTVQCTFADRRKHDLDNMLAACKGFLDGIVDSGLLVDDSGLTYTIPPARVDKASPGVTITIERVDG